VAPGAAGLVVSQSSTVAVLDAVGASIEAVVDGLTRSPQLLDPRTAPATRLRKAYSLHPATRNTHKYRDGRGADLNARMRLNMELTVRCVWLINPKDQTATQTQALDDIDAMVHAVLTDTREPLPSCRTLFLRSPAAALPPSREWLFHDVVFGVEFDRSLLATHN